MPTDVPPAADYLELVQLKNEYCYRIDERDYDAWVELFTDDGVFGIKGVETFEGREEVRRFATEVFDEEYAYTAHVVANPVLSVNGDEASGKWYLFLPFTGGDGSVGWMQSRYDDAYRRVDGEWKVSKAIVSRQASRRQELSGLAPVP